MGDVFFFLFAGDKQARMDYEDFLQGCLNDQPSIGRRQLLKTLKLTMHVSCSDKAMRTWLDHHEPITAEPDIAEHEDFLWEQLKKKPNSGYTAMCTAIRKS